MIKAAPTLGLAAAPARTFSVRTTSSPTWAQPWGWGMATAPGMRAATRSTTVLAQMTEGTTTRWLRTPTVPSSRRYPQKVPEVAPSSAKPLAPLLKREATEWAEPASTGRAGRERAPGPAPGEEAPARRGDAARGLVPVPAQDGVVLGLHVLPRPGRRPEVLVAEGAVVLRPLRPAGLGLLELPLDVLAVL